ncbi:DUF956 family protein [Lactobacillus mulieris]|uniref:DUF956 family protein n=1 Tax=Lactobacillus mulieris TaxID=2508708 RepID=UPI001433351A|nr:DUF956 family protein [Lactobacillus mulieris]MCF1783873.1 DUF956 family protein [Lactobacillus mulieris]MCW8104735.1 DUF956 family protein [Lactobacillus mulieris]MDK6803644.1 DUF956 family protein [Lactobacillus mulieris]MDK8382802.1 DUF956 family protein [Lactobacillus mulieris]MDT9620953.1 DUF956 family protein [Lactobacillus mulieris]
MVQSLNTTSDYVTKATWQRGIPCYGQIMIGDKGFEFYNDKNLLDYIQIPWNEITYVVADVHFKGKYIPRFELRTRNNGNFIFSAKQPVLVLKAIRKYIPANHMRQALSLWQKIKLRFK